MIITCDRLQPRPRVTAEGATYLNITIHRPLSTLLPNEPIEDLSIRTYAHPLTTCTHLTEWAAVHVRRGPISIHLRRRNATTRDTMPNNDAPITWYLQNAEHHELDVIPHTEAHTLWFQVQQNGNGYFFGQQFHPGDTSFHITRTTQAYLAWETIPILTYRGEC